jgi:hypothetical protein
MISMQMGHQYVLDIVWLKPQLPDIGMYQQFIIVCPKTQARIT